MTQVITPTPGRIVHFFPGVADGVSQAGRGTSDAQPLAAIVAMVHNERMVNLCVFDAYGNPHARPNVYLSQPDKDVPNDGTSYAKWMDYQVKSAGIELPVVEASAPASDVAAQAEGSTADAEADTGEQAQEQQAAEQTAEQTATTGDQQGE